MAGLKELGGAKGCLLSDGSETATQIGSIGRAELTDAALVTQTQRLPLA